MERLVAGLLWATLVLGVRAGLWLAGLLLGMGVALFPHLVRLIVWISSEGMRIYSRHLMEESPYRNTLSLAAITFATNLAIGATIMMVSDIVLGWISVLISLGFWVAQIELLDLRLRHSAELEDYLNPWKH